MSDGAPRSEPADAEIGNSCTRGRDSVSGAGTARPCPECPGRGVPYDFHDGIVTRYSAFGLTAPGEQLPSHFQPTSAPQNASESFEISN